MTVHAEDLYAKNKYTPFEGRELRGAVRQTYVRGNQVYDSSGKFPAGAGYGKFIKAV
jgi:dihydroorotase-like cyclic amidohydrolase